MAVKFPLEMANGVQARTLKDLKENFDVERMIGYLLDGKLHSWLESHYYEELADMVSQIDKNDVNLAKKLCEIFEVEYTETETIDAEELMEKNERTEKLKQFTDDEEIIKNIHLVAFNQEELAELYDNEETKIYLCEGEFDIPKSKQDLDYVVIGDAKVSGLAKKENKHADPFEEIRDSQTTDEAFEKLIKMFEEENEKLAVAIDLVRLDTEDLVLDPSSDYANTQAVINALVDAVKHRIEEITEISKNKNNSNDIEYQSKKTDSFWTAHIGMMERIREESYDDIVGSNAQIHHFRSIMMHIHKKPLIDAIGEEEANRVFSALGIDWFWVQDRIKNGRFDPGKSLVDGVNREIKYIFSPFLDTDDKDSN